MQIISVSTAPRRFIRNIIVACLISEVLLVILDLWLNHGKAVSSTSIQHLFNLAREGSIGSWFSSTQTLFVGITLWLIFLGIKNEPNSHFSKTFGWALLAVFFTYMAIDDAAAIHERLGSAFEDLHVDKDDEDLGITGILFEKYPSYAWQFILGPFYLGMGVFLLVFLWRELQTPRLRILILLALACFSTAVGLDYVEGLYGGYKRIIVATSMDYETVLHYAKVLEEFLEMLGTSLFLWAFLIHLTQKIDNITINFEPSTPPR